LNRPRPIRDLIVLGLAFVVGIFLLRHLRFSNASLNYIFGWALLCIPFIALRPISKLPRIPKVIGLVLVSPLLLLCLFMAMMSVACDFDLHPYSKGSCRQALESVEQDGCSVYLIRDGCGGALASWSLFVEQRRQLFPWIYVFRSVDFFDQAYEGSVTSAGANKIRVQIPKGTNGSGWNQEIDRTYTLKRHLYF
jgi:hypothetical protein